MDQEYRTQFLSSKCLLSSVGLSEMGKRHLYQTKLQMHPKTVKGEQQKERDSWAEFMRETFWRWGKDSNFRQNGDFLGQYESKKAFPIRGFHSQNRSKTRLGVGRVSWTELTTVIRVIMVCSGNDGEVVYCLAREQDPGVSLPSLPIYLSAIFHHVGASYLFNH